MTKETLCLIFVGPPGAGKGTQALRISKALGFPIVSMGALIRAIFGRETDFDAEGLRIAFGDNYRDKISTAIRSTLEELKAKRSPLGEFTVEDLHRMHDEGKLLPDELIMTFLKHALMGIKDEISRGMILDGVPRTVKQAEMLDEVLSEVGIAKLRVVLLDVPKEECFNRIIRRAKEQPTREDYAKFDVRWKEYEEKTVPMIEYYEKKGVLIRVNGVGTIEEITERILKALGLRSPCNPS